MKGKANEIASMLGRKLMDEEFTRLVALGQKITDYQDKSVEEGEDDNLDEEQGVALIFDRDDEDEAADGADGLQDRDEDDDLDVVREEEVDEDAEPAGGEETIVRANLGDIGKQAAADQVDPREVDAFWLQRQLGQYSKDAVETQKLAETTLSVLQESKDDRDCENRLVQALGFERFEFVKLLRKNRNVVLYCTLLARASNKVERQTIEAKMRSSDELAPILKVSVKRRRK